MLQNAYNILHLSHTDIRYDSRILKEMEAIARVNVFQVFGIGINLDEGSTIGKISADLSLKSLRLLSKRFTFLPRALRYFINFIELTIKMFFLGLQYKPKVIHCHDTLVLPVGVLISIFSRALVVYDAHELESDKNGQTKLLSLSTLLMEKVCWPFVDLFISVSESINDWYVNRFGYKSNLVILNSPVVHQQRDSDRQPKARYFNERYKIGEDNKIFVYLGILSEGRGIDACLQAFSQLGSRGAHVVFVGYGPLKERIENYASEYSNIHFHPAVAHEEVVSLVESADVGLCFIENVSLSDYYCLPNKLFEYSFAGLPVLASDFPEIRKIVQKYSLGVCAEPSVESIKHAVLTFLEDADHTAPKDLTDLSWEFQAQKLGDAYKKMLGV